MRNHSNPIRMELNKSDELGGYNQPPKKLGKLTKLTGHITANFEFDNQFEEPPNLNYRTQHQNGNRHLQSQDARFWYAQMPSKLWQKLFWRRYKPLGHRLYRWWCKKKCQTSPVQPIRLNSFWASRKIHWGIWGISSNYYAGWPIIGANYDGAINLTRFSGFFPSGLIHLPDIYRISPNSTSSALA